MCMTTRLARRCTRCLILSSVIVGSTMLVACDGGLFGTGDPSSDSSVIDVAETPESTTGGSAGDALDAVDGDVNDADVAPEAVIDVPLNNSDVTTTRNDALLQIMNFSETTISLPALMLEGPALTPASITEAVSVPDDVFSIDVLNPAAQPIARLSPISLAAGSATGVLLRNPASDTTLDVRSFSIRTRADSPDTVLVRSIFAGSETSAPLNLLPRNSAVEITFPELTPNNPIGEYTTALAGDYTVQLNSVNQLEVQLLPGSAYSLVIDPASATAVRLLIDSELE